MITDAQLVWYETKKVIEPMFLIDEIVRLKAAIRQHRNLHRAPRDKRDIDLWACVEEGEHDD